MERNVLVFCKYTEIASLRMMSGNKNSAKELILR